MDSLGNSLSCMDRLVHNQQTCLFSGSSSERFSLPHSHAFSGANCDPVRVSKPGAEIGAQEGRQERARCTQPHHHGRPLRFGESSDKLPSQFEGIKRSKVSRTEESGDFRAKIPQTSWKVGRQQACQLIALLEEDRAVGARSNQ